MPRYTAVGDRFRMAAPCTIWLLVAVLASLVFAPLSVAKEPPTGAMIYEQRCAECHGVSGEGVAEARDEPLYGDLPLDQLTKLIVDTMPEGAPEDCTGEEAAKVAEYIHTTFYTPEARALGNPPRVALSRLTVSQYLNTAADLLADFSGAVQLDERRGLLGRYYNARNFRNKDKVFERIDAEIAFDFGEASPDPDQIEAEAFAMRWEGSVLAEETGDYAFRVRTQNGARLWVNDEDRMLIDGWVSSGAEVREHTETIRLLGGRAYPMKLHFFTFKEQAASIVLEWKPPHKTWQVIPGRYLSPVTAPPSLVVETAFPPDDGSLGYERGASVSKAWDEAATYAAIEIAGKVVDDLDRLTKSKAGDEDRTPRVKAFCHKFVERAFRRPLTDEEQQFFVDAPFESSAPLELTVKRTVILVLKSPRFLYPGVGSAADDYDVAARLALGLWDSLPDEQLLAAASRGELRSSEAVAAHARRMLADPRAKAKVRDFFHHWLPYEEADDASKDVEEFPGFDEALLADLRTSLDLFIDEIVWSDRSDFRELLLADYLLLNDRLAEFYGVDLSAQGDFQKAPQDPIERAGVVTHPYLLAALAYHKSSSPIHRGVFATRKLLGRSLKPPPMAIQFMDGGFDPHMTMREKVAELTKSETCQACHRVINPLGFSLEHYDAVGRYRTVDKDRPIDAAGEYPSLSGELIPLSGARDLAEYAAHSSEAHRGFVEHLFHHLVKQPVNAYGASTLDELTESFAAAEFNIQALLVEIMRLTVLHELENPQEESDES